MNKLYHSPGTCSLGVHCLIEEVGAPYELVKIDLMKGQQHSGEYTAVNAKSKVPALLREDGSLLTEWPAIATWLALTYPEKGLLPTDAEGLARTLEHVDYMVATLHMQGFTRIWRPDHFASSEAEQEVVRKKGRDIYEKGLAHFEAKLDGRDYLGGKAPSIADFALFYICFWKANRLKEPFSPNLAAHHARMRARPSVAKALADEGFA
jgi:glutathione S-transferase